MSEPSHSNDKSMKEGCKGTKACACVAESGPCSSISSASDDSVPGNTAKTARGTQCIGPEAPHDPDDPLNWPTRRKLSIVLDIALLSALGQMASSMLAPAAEQVISEFHSADPTLGVLVVCVFLLGMAVGLLFTSGLSDVYGRRPVIHATNLLFVVFGVATAVSRSLGQLVVFRLLQGVAAAAPPAIGGGVIGDMFVPCERGRATAIYGFGLLLGPIVGPVAGGYITQRLGWRWMCWIISISGALSLIGTIPVLKETYRPVLLERKLRKLHAETNNDSDKMFSGNTRRRFRGRLGDVRSSVVQPMKFLVLDPTVALPALGLAVILGIMFLMLSTMSTVYQQLYGWSIGASGLPYLGLGAGLFTGLAVYSCTADRAYTQLGSSRVTKPPPEIRLAPISLGSPLCAVGLVIYGWAFEKQLHWVLPIVGCVVFSWGMVAFTMPVTTYLIDVFHAEAAGPVGASAVLRCLVGGLLPLCSSKLYNTLGFGWGNSLLAFLALAFTPFPYLFYKYGDRLRKSSAGVRHYRDSLSRPSDSL